MKPVSRTTLGTAAALLTLILLAALLYRLQPPASAWNDPGWPRVSWAGAVVLAYLLFCVAVFFLRRKPAVVSSAADGPALLIAYASQTGYAEQLARQTMASLQQAGLASRVVSLGSVDAAALERAGRALFIVSTTGEGDAPDGAYAFVQRAMSSSAALAGLEYGLLALGDRSYRNYCAFGHALEAWLRHQGASPLFDRVEVDDGDAGALRHWQHHLGMLAGNSEMADWSEPSYARWCLVERRLLNPGSLGGAAFHLAFEPLDAAAQWLPGDIAEVGPRHAQARVEQLLRSLDCDSALRTEGEGGETLGERLAHSLLPHDNAEIQAWSRLLPTQLQLQPLPHREYSIASLATDGRLELLVRQMRQPDGSLGLGSGWLTEYAPVGAEIALRIRSNSGFHPPIDARPLILIGNGTGLAGLRAHLKARARAGQRRNWLLFGERSAAHDYFHREEIEAWLADGVLQRLDLTFSRDQPQRIYVQDRLRAAGAALRDWIAEGASVYVCGSLAGMAPGVDAVLREVLGVTAYENFVVAGRYRRDVY